jgi:hypothetical protein
LTGPSLTRAQSRELEMAFKMMDVDLSFEEVERTLKKALCFVRCVRTNAAENE